MEIRCKCGSGCLKPAPQVLKNFEILYHPCPHCKEWKLKKFTPLIQQMDLDKFNGDFGRCACGKRHLDLVIAQILKIMIEEGLKDEKSTLRNACVPLITPAYPTNSVPYLPKNSLVILAPELNKKTAERILKEVPEVKGVLKGDLRDTVGIKDSESNPNIYELLAGCDMRCDLVYTPYGTICIFKNQGQIHIEFPKPLSPKIKKLKEVLDKFDAPSVLDCTCGPGTLGIAALKSGAKKVVLNDLWYPAALTTALNLEINGFPVKISSTPEGLIAAGGRVEVYCLDVKDLKNVLSEKFDICIVDTFPDVDSTDFVASIRDICSEVLVI